jgi:hypothetical protein
MQAFQAASPQTLPVFAPWVSILANLSLQAKRLRQKPGHLGQQTHEAANEQLLVFA